MNSIGQHHSHPRFRHRLPGLLCTILLAAATPTHAAAPDIQRADELLPVDCLLPGAVRKLGGQLTYLTARRPIKTTGVNCEIRGGEYVLYDRANYKTSLAIWLPQAEAGDPKAQNYVGEIYEKGLGTEPDFALAAQWYRKAADQDYAPAQVNLGQLHELGRGVDADMEQAISLYRDAAGIKGKQLSFVSWDYSEEKYAAMTQQIAGQDAAMAQQQRKIEELTRRLDASQSRESQLVAEVAASRSQYRQELLMLEKSREQLAAREAQLSAIARQNSQSATDKAEREQQARALAAEREALADQRSDLEQEKAALRKQAQQIAGLASQTSEQDAALAAERAALAERTDTVAAQLAELSLKEAALAEQSVQLQQERQKLQQQLNLADNRSQALDAQQKELELLRAEVTQRESELASRESELFSKNSELQSLSQQLALLQSQLKDNASTVATPPADTPDAPEAGAKPVIEMIEPRLLATRGERMVVKTRAGIDQRTIIGRVLGPNTIMQLLVNEELVRIDERGIFQQRIPLTGKETAVTVVAIDELGLRSDLEFLLGIEDTTETDLTLANQGKEQVQNKGRKAPKLNFGNFHALIIGNKDYQTLPDLDTTITDAEALRDVLSTRYGFKTTLLTDATRYDILSAMEKLRQELTEDDNLLIYYAGHGELDEVNSRGHWLPVDAEEASRANWISNVAISDILNSMSANKVLVIADSCYSGSMTRSTLARLDAGRSDQAWISWLKKQATSHSRLIFSSGGNSPVLDGGGGKHSIFAKALLDVLSSNDGVLEGREIHAQVAQAVNYAALAAQFDQTPQYAPIKFAGHEGGDFLFVAASN
jgi:TPR repeat protein